MNTNIHGLIHKKNANNLPYINKFYIFAFNSTKSFAYTHAKILLIFLLTSKYNHMYTQTNLHSFHTFKTNIYTHSDKKNHALQTGIHTFLHTII